MFSYIVQISYAECRNVDYTLKKKLPSNDDIIYREIWFYSHLNLVSHHSSQARHVNSTYDGKVVKKFMGNSVLKTVNSGLLVLNINISEFYKYYRRNF